MLGGCLRADQLARPERELSLAAPKFEAVSARRRDGSLAASKVDAVGCKGEGLGALLEGARLHSCMALLKRDWMLRLDADEPLNDGENVSQDSIRAGSGLPVLRSPEGCAAQAVGECLAM